MTAVQTCRLVAPSSKNSAASRQVGDAAHAGDGQARNERTTSSTPKRGKHIQGDRFYGRSGIAAMAALPANTGSDFERVRDRRRQWS